MNNESVGSKNTFYEDQRRQLEKLMSDPEKPVYIPSPVKEHKPREPREFIRNIWGSSAGVGSGDFHIYRGIRRRQMEREEYMAKKTEKETLDGEFAEKKRLLDEQSEEKTARKRLKRQKKKTSKKTKIEPKQEEIKPEEISGNVSESDEKSEPENAVCADSAAPNQKETEIKTE